MHETFLCVVVVVLNLACVLAAWFVAYRFIARRLDQFEQQLRADVREECRQDLWDEELQNVIEHARASSESRFAFNREEEPR